MNDLVLRAKNKDRDAELELINRFKPLILAKEKKYNFEKLPVEDYLQEGVVVILEAVESFEFEKNVPFEAYLSKQMFYHFVEPAKNFRFNDSLDKEVNEIPLLELIPCVDNDIDPLIETELYTSLKICLKKLRPRQFWIINEYYFKKRSLKSLAKEVNLSANALSQYHRRTLKQLQTLLLEAGINDTPFG